MALALTAALTSAALAGAPVTSTGAARPGPVALTEAQMDTIMAGGGVGSVDPGGGSLILYGGTDEVTGTGTEVGAGAGI